MNKTALVLGDLFALSLLTFIGFASHGETDASYLPRMAITFLSQAAGWFLLVPALSLFSAEVVRRARCLWRPALGAFFAAQFAVVLRGLWLGEAVQPLFGVVLGLTSALGMTAWRGIWLWLDGQSRARD